MTNRKNTDGDSGGLPCPTLEEWVAFQAARDLERLRGMVQAARDLERLRGMVDTMIATHDEVERERDEARAERDEARAQLEVQKGCAPCAAPPRWWVKQGEERDQLARELDDAIAALCAIDATQGNARALIDRHLRRKGRR